MNFCFTPQRSLLTHISYALRAESAASNRASPQHHPRSAFPGFSASAIPSAVLVGGKGACSAKFGRNLAVVGVDLG